MERLIFIPHIALYYNTNYKENYDSNDTDI